ncbi:transcription-repair coupling factor [Dehalococcoidia bacterium]|nr:transcription-repair coupling factor [Dehalococcoidia bacterium]
MNLSGLRALMRDVPAYHQLIQGNGRQKTVVLEAATPFLLACLYHDLGVPLLVVTPGVERAKGLHEELSKWCHPDAPVRLFPEIDILPYERLFPDPSTVQQRLQVLSILNEWNSLPSGLPPLIVASAYAVARKTLLPADFASACQVVKKGMRIEPDTLIAQWIRLGYEMAQVIETPGTISKRGGIVDIFSPGNDLPARIEFLGDEVESIRWFDPGTQRSVGFTDSVAIVPAGELPPPERELIEGSFGENGGAITDYLPRESLVVLDDPEGIVAEAIWESEAAGLRPAHFTWSEIQERLGTIKQLLSLQKWGDERVSSLFDFGAAPGYGGQVSRFLEDTETGLRDGRRIVIVSQQSERLSELLREQDIPASPQAQLDQLPPLGSLTLVHGSLAGGWAWNGTLLLTDAELFGFVKKRRPAPKRRAQQEVFLADLSVGDHVVHVDHGIAMFSGITRIASDGTEREYLILEYAEGDRLYLPSDQVDRVARYIGSGGYFPSLSRLSTQEWTRTKQRVKKAAAELAQELVAIYASREISSGIGFSPDTVWQQEFEASFPYVETPDQLETIRSVKEDMEKSRPMDRLVCGDVGYGKTEVAVRAAFKAVMDGMQVAVLVPTTVLAQQHFITFAERLAAFPIKIEVLSRFRSPREQQDVLAGLANGAVDICIGTHRLLQRDVVFKDLGLVIIDEEQKFGVAHKERLKQLRREVDVLTLSATPIPRTLHMSLIGVRDMSTMETPPEARLPIKTYVAEYDDGLIRSAILRELDRNGQVFFVHNRVQSIAYVAGRLRDLLPEARIAVAHGQMPEELLESVMVDFIAGKVDVLVCTVIIESGLDLPNVNTLIVNQSDKLGLTQLYHLRGRVGRGDVRAYAYFLYEKGKRLTEPARKRLKTIFEATELGAGFRIAMKDLEIRGAGNILGPEQSGHIGAVGFDLYCRLLSEAVEELKSGEEKRGPRRAPLTVDLPITAYIPEEYVPDLNTRLALYQRLANLDSMKRIEDIRQELKDRFGRMPLPVQNLLYLVRIKLLGTEAGVQKISAEGKQILLRMGSEAKLDRALLQSSFGSSLKVGTTQVRLDKRQLGQHWARVLEAVLRLAAGCRLPAAGC